MTNDDLLCQYCGKQCKNLNSLKQHECRCPKNKNRKAYNNLTEYIIKEVKGKTKNDLESIARQVATVKDKYKNGYQHPNKGKHRVIEQIYSEHNQLEINKWLRYQAGLNITLPLYQTIMHNQGYKVISKMHSKNNNTVELMFEHDYLANILLNGELPEGSTVHHIDKNRANNSLDNLMIFKNSISHKRFHTAKRAYLIYDEKSCLFDCVIK